jgi:hypothetical protein
MRPSKTALVALVVSVLALVATVEANLLAYGAQRSRSADTRQRVDEARAALRSQRHVLAELCRVSGVIDGLVESTTVLLTADAAVAPKALRPVYRQTLATFVGYQSVLSQQTACATVKRP